MFLRSLPRSFIFSQYRPSQELLLLKSLQIFANQNFRQSSQLLLDLSGLSAIRSHPVISNLGLAGKERSPTFRVKERNLDHPQANVTLLGRRICFWEPFDNTRVPGLSRQGRAVPEDLDVITAGVTDYVEVPRATASSGPPEPPPSKLDVAPK